MSDIYDEMKKEMTKKEFRKLYSLVVAANLDTNKCRHCEKKLEKTNRKGQPKSFCNRRCNKAYWGLRVKPLFTHCECCGVAFPVKSGQGRVPKFCREQCVKEALATSKLTAAINNRKNLQSLKDRIKQNELLWKQGGKVKKCPTCLTEFINKRNQKYCDPKCRGGGV